MLEIIDAILGEDFLLSGTTSMHIGPGETAQLLHSDDGMITLPRPHPATMVTTMWALSNFQEKNGATRLVPGSHKNEASMPQPGGGQETLAAEMPAGSVMFLHASTWHGGGPNRTNSSERYGLSIQYVAGWCRQQQNLMLGTPREVVATYSRKLQELIGYSMYQNVMGHVDREHPLTLLGVEESPNMVWDKMDNPDSVTRGDDS
jgi:ectoine hydroxylase-related dioxygenase (phytanoyl-CoA dioxygenase family)